MRKNIVGAILVAIAVTAYYSFFAPQQSITEPKFVFSRAEYEVKHYRLGGPEITLTVTNRGTTAEWTLVQIIDYSGDIIIQHPDLYWDFWYWDQDDSYVMWGPMSFQEINRLEEGDVINIRVYYTFRDPDAEEGEYIGIVEKEVFLEYKLKKGDVTIR